MNDPLPAIQREAWLLLAAANPDAGFSTAINTTTAPDVTEAILWASITTNPDQAAPLLAAAQQWSTTPARRDAYRTSLYLLGRSTDDTAIHYLSDRARTGDADALTALKLLAARSDADSEVGVLLNEIDDESMVPDINTDLTLLAAGDADAIKRALRATTTPTADGLTPEQEVMTRWLAWYDHAPAEQAGLSAEGGADPVAADGSVWAAVLLAERTLTPGEAADLADTWIHDLDDNVKRAGLLLAGLCGTHPIEIQRLLDEAETVDVRRAARLASGMVSRDDTANRGACRRIAEAESDHPGRFNEALLALLAAGDPDAVDQLLQPGPNLTPGTPTPPVSLAA
ncbi:MAG: hypothetical protein HND57_04840 [Planctomycetes bacterium]|nr:hypothetical protein [Planctomycetota bacterium]